MGTQDIRTKKKACELGLRTEDGWKKRRLMPRIGETPVIVKGAGYYAESQCEPLISKAEGDRRGLTLRNEAVPSHKAHTQKTGYFNLFRESDFRQKNARTETLARIIDLLEAISVVNRSAKRYRDQAEAHYRDRRHGLAANCRSKKLHYYQLKEKGIAAAIAQGRLSYKGSHIGMAVYAGTGYSFHSCLIPIEVTELEETDERFFKESCPKSAGEARLKDAVFTLEELSDIDNEGDFWRVEPPQFKQAKLVLEYNIFAGIAAESEEYNDEFKDDVEL